MSLFVKEFARLLVNNSHHALLERNVDKAEEDKSVSEVSASLIKENGRLPRLRLQSPIDKKAIAYHVCLLCEK